MKKTTQKGFTLIELLVVIAIIGILAGILFIAIDPSAQTNKAEDAKRQSQVASIRTQAALVFSDTSPSSFATVCTNANVVELLKSGGTTVGVCRSDPNEWAVSIPLVSKTPVKHICADSTGITKETNGALAANILVCP